MLEGNLELLEVYILLFGDGFMVCNCILNVYFIITQNKSRLFNPDDILPTKQRLECPCSRLTWMILELPCFSLWPD
jgi:hypothetical protein